MKSKPPQANAESVALQRFARITKIQDLWQQGFSLAKALRQAASAPIVDDPGPPPKTRTLEDWWYAYQHGGFAALYPKERTDKGKSRKLDSEQQQWILHQVRSHPKICVKVLYRRWLQQGRQLPSLGAIYRFLREHDLDAKARTRLCRQPISGPTKAFEAPFANDLWMVDFSPGPYLQLPGHKKARPTHLCLIIDDYSRLIPFGAYYLNADTPAFHQTLKEAIQRRGIPFKLYTDQGAPFTNAHSKIVCANLGIRLLHAKPYHAWSKGKIERIFFTLQQDFEALLSLPGEAPQSLEELNQRLSHWLQNDYHTRVHSATQMSPQQRFSQHRHLIRHLESEPQIERLFFTRLARTVRKDGTIRLDNQLYEVDLSLRGMRVELRLDPAHRERIEVYHRGHAFGLANPLDRHLNFRIEPNQNHAKNNPDKPNQ